LLINPREDSLQHGHLLFITIGPKPVAQFFKRHIDGQWSHIGLPILCFRGGKRGCENRCNIRRTHLESIVALPRSDLSAHLSCMIKGG